MRAPGGDAGPRGRYITANGVKLHYIEYPGEGPNVVLIPGITSPAITWGFVGQRLREFCRVLILDNRGRGLSSAGATLGYDLVDYAADTSGLIAQLGLDRPVVLGHSMGGRIALRLAADYPEQVGRAIIADPPVTGPGRRSYPVPVDWYLDGIDAASRGEELDTSSPLVRNWTPEQLALRAEWLPTCDKTAVARSHESFHTEDIHSLLPAIRCPVHLIYAELGNTVSDDDAEEFRNMTEDCTVTKIDGAGHMIPWDDLDGFVKAVRNCLSG